MARIGAKQPDMYLETLFSAMQMIESGITTVVHIQPLQRLRADGMLEDSLQVLRAYAASGMRVAYSQPMRDQNRIVYGDDAFLASLPQNLGARARSWIAGTAVSQEDYFAMAAELFERCGRNQRERIRILVSPTNVQWCSDALLLAAKEFASRADTGLHIHVQESLYQKEYGQRVFGKTPLAHLADLDILGPTVSICHGVWLTESDIELLQKTGAMLTTQASSNLRLKSGIAPLNRLLACGVTVAVGIDEAGINDDNDMLQEMRLIAKLHRTPGINQPNPTSGQVLRMATANGAKVSQFGDRIGSIESGKRADLVLLDLERIAEPYLDDSVSIADALLHRGRGMDVDTVMIDGDIILRDREFTRLNRGEVVNQLRESLNRDLTSPECERKQLAEDLMPHIKRFYEDWDYWERRPYTGYNSAV